jgi:hypothetical protein
MNEPEKEFSCGCCLGYGSHERYIPEQDRWEQFDCVMCGGTGKLTESKIKRLREFVIGPVTTEDIHGPT